MKKIEKAAMEAECVSIHQSCLTEEISRGVDFLLRKFLNEPEYREHFSTLKKQIRVLNGEYEPGDEVKTRNADIGRIVSVIGDLPNQKIKIVITSTYDESEQQFVTLPRTEVNHLCTGEEFYDESSELPF